MEIKRGEARDCWDLNNEVIIDGGEEMLGSITNKDGELSENKHGNTFKSKMEQHADKNINQKGEKENLNKKEGLFLTNIISKIFEKVQDRIW